MIYCQMFEFRCFVGCVQSNFFMIVVFFSRILMIFGFGRVFVLGVVLFIGSILDFYFIICEQYFLSCDNLKIRLDIFRFFFGDIIVFI